MIGNGFCNDETNNVNCNFDGGDCCGPCVNKKDCSECFCLGMNISHVGNPIIGDGLCNDETNKEECNYDGGDCCGPCVVRTHCSECSCLSELYDQEVINPLIGNGFCNDETNNLECEFDGGDCCGSCILKEHCSKCQCLNETSIEIYHTLSHINEVSHILIGNGQCNDETNNAECNFDGNDCCMKHANTAHCSECDPKNRGLYYQHKII